MDDARRSALWIAADHGNTGAILALLKNKADQRLADTEGRTPLHRPLENGNADSARLRIVDRFDVDSTTMAGNTPLILAAKSGMTEVARLLLEIRCPPRCPEQPGIQCPHDGFLGGTTGGRQRALLKAGADRNLRNKKRETAIDITTAAGQAEIAQPLK